MKLGYTVKFIGNPNMIAIDKANGKRREICRFDDKGFFITDDAAIAVKLVAKGIPYKEVKKASKPKSKKTEEKTPFDE